MEEVQLEQILVYGGIFIICAITMYFHLRK
jgi:hypothetical protein